MKIGNKMEKLIMIILGIGVIMGVFGIVGIVFSEINIR
ncbi:MAG: hypothetical protein RLZZ428_635 [Pseudomonadota bacterium]